MKIFFHYLSTILIAIGAALMLFSGQLAQGLFALGVAIGLDVLFNSK